MGDKIHGLCSRIMKCPELTEDAYWFTIYQIWDKCKQFKFNSKFESWCYRVTSNCCFMKLRSLSKSPTDGLKDEMTESELEKFLSNIPDTTNILEDCAFNELASYVENARLQPFYKKAIILRATGHSNTDASRILNCSIPAFKSRFHRARQDLNKQLRWLGYETRYKQAANW